MRRRRLPPDTRPDWRDPNMPVLRYMQDTEQVEEFAPEDQQQASQFVMAGGGEGELYYDDPTYNLRKRRRHVR